MCISGTTSSSTILNFKGPEPSDLSIIAFIRLRRKKENEEVELEVSGNDLILNKRYIENR